MTKRPIAIQFDLQSHYIDHLGVLCAILNIPYLFIDEQQLQIAQKYYPGLNARYVEREEITPLAIHQNYDILFTSHCWNRALFEEAFEICGKKSEIFSIFCPHGNSDKGSGPGGLELFLQHDAVLIYGQHMIDFLKEVNVWQRLGKRAITGNFRYSYYKQHSEFYDKIMREEILSYFPEERKILLFSPTWNLDFFETHAHVLRSLPDEYNVIVKVHPRLMTDHLGLMCKVLGNYENRSNILFLTDFPLIFPLLQHVDVYVGDVSSIGYDFLAFNKPMFFMNSYPNYSNPKRTFFLYQCGVEILPPDYHRIHEVIQNHLSSSNSELPFIREKMYRYAFGEDRSLAEIKKSIKKLLN